MTHDGGGFVGGHDGGTGGHDGGAGGHHHQHGADGGMIPLASSSTETGGRIRRSDLRATVSVMAFLIVMIGLLIAVAYLR